MMNIGMRFFIAAIVILLIMKLNNYSLHLDAKSIKIYLILAVFSYAIPFWMVYWAESHIPSSLASILFGVYPFSVAILSSIFIVDEKLTVSRFGGISMAFVGLVIIFSHGLKVNLENYLTGMILVVASAVFQSGIAVMMKRHGGYLNPLSMNFIPFFLASIGLIVFSFLFEELTQVKFTVISISYVLYLAIIVTVFNFTVYYWLMKKISVVILALTSFITPIVAVTVGWLFHGERLTGNVFLGALFVLFGIIVVNWQGINKYYHQRFFKSM
jgi:drug/metabolite transporter (DMT)-like permease